MLEHILVIIGLFIGSLVDLKLREIPDVLTYSMVAIGLIFGLIKSLIVHSIYPVLFSVFGLMIAYLIGQLFYYTRQWGGGDSKALWGIGAILGVSFFEPNFFTQFFIVFIILLFLFGAIYGVAWIISLAIVRYKEFKPEFLKLIHSKPVIKTRKIIVGIVVVLCLIIIFLESLEQMTKIYLLFVLILFYLLFLFNYFIKAIENSCMIRKISVSKLTEGDWLVEEVKISKNKVVEMSNVGLSTQQILTLKKHKIKTVKVKEGIPFLPSFLIAYVLTLLLHGWIVNLFL